MKELTIQEKAEAYDKAIIRGSQLWESDAITRGNYEYIFPELKESEDERIRKNIIAASFGAISHGILTDAEYKEIYTWLKKEGEKPQGKSAQEAIKEEKIEQNAAELSNICEFSLETWIKIVDFVLTEHKGIGNYLDSYETKDTAEKLREKYKFDAASEEWDRVYRKGLDAGVNKGKAIALREQNPTWSEEDKNMLQSILDEYKSMPIEKRNWLKSLKDRYAWKPSDDQMRELGVVATGKGLFSKEILRGLLEQLKKLREE